MSYSLISSIIKGAWAIDPQSAIAYGPFVSSLIKGESVSFDNKAERPYNVNMQNPDDEYSSGKVRVIPIKGVLLKDDQECGPIGTASMGYAIRSADNDRSVNAILLDIDTPGGSVDGTEVLEQIIKATEKPVVAFVNGLMASAGTWIGSAADTIIASTMHDKIGSIGVMISFMDVQPMWEKQGVKFHEIYSDKSKDKNLDFKKLTEGNYDSYREEVLNPLAENFHKTIKANRPNVKPEQMTGKMYFAKDLLGTLIDEVGTIDYALSVAIKLANSNNNSNTNSNTKAMSGDKNMFADEKSAQSWLSKVFGLKTVESQKAEKEALAIKAAEALKIADAKKVQDDKDLAKETELTTAQERIATLEAENASLKQKPGAVAAVVVKKTDSNVAADPYHIEMSEGTSVVDQFAEFKNALDSSRK